MNGLKEKIRSEINTCLLYVDYEILNAKQVEDIKECKINVLGESGIFLQLLSDIGELAPDARIDVGTEANEIYKIIESRIDNAIRSYSEVTY